MKSYLVIFFISFLVGASCKKDNLYWGYVKAQKNGINWDAKIRAGYSTRFSGKFDLVFEKYDVNNIRIEESAFETIPQNTGRYRLFKRDFTFQDPEKVTFSFFTLSDDGDVLCDRYNVIESDSVNNYIQIDDYNSGNNEIRGKFALRLLVQLPKCKSTAPDTLTFLNGDFHAKIK